MSESNGIVERDGVWTLDNNSSWDGAEIIIAQTVDGISIAVTEEKAMDSYNRDFTCSIRLSREEAESLAVFILRATARNPAKRLPPNPSTTGDRDE